MPNQPTGDPKQHSTDKFADGISGSCLCGSITVTIQEKGLFDRPRGHLCHCANCRKVAGSYVASNLLMEEEKVDIDDRDGTLKTYEDRATLSGNPVYRSFCGKDGNPVCSKTALYAGKVVVKMGMMPRIPQPEAEGFSLHRHEWQGRHKGVPSYKIKWAGPDKEEHEFDA
ncbi:Glutathione-dependent formaldehyde-activating enzyme [Teratosphaeria destructans]|uniref:Glutathione-dependent formaldehyde-activating enzyme n=1 Tax=Teratosphaeria destructans TaxID=418781 RepID=A0A9W7SJB9_9PEZI|nr:Glutathione-dependent formaldehyde-activating enzyme [Teratosphaeria destructans]